MGKLRRIPKPAERQSVAKFDGWQNAFTGIGDPTRDKRKGAVFGGGTFIDQSYAEDIWRGDDMAARAVETVPDEMLREGFCVTVPNDKELSEKVDEIVRAMDIVSTVKKALYYERAYGGGGIYPGLEDGERDKTKPLRMDRIKSFTHVTVFTPDELVALSWYADPLREKYGQPALFQMVPFIPPQRGQTIPNQYPQLHETRLVRFVGIQTSIKSALTGSTSIGWGDSVFVRLLEVLQDFQQTWASTGVLMQDFAPAILKMKGLVELLSAAKANPGGVDVRERMRALEMSRSVAGVSLIDKDEEYKRETTDVSGLGDMLDKWMGRLAAAVDMPVSLLAGQAPAGLNATGDSEIRWFYDRIRSKQQHKLKPLLRKLIQFIFLAKDGPTKGKEPANWELYFNPLWQTTETEQADVRLKTAQADALWVNTGVVLPEEVAKSHFSGDEFSPEIQVDFDLRKAATADHEAQQEAAQNPKLGPDGKPVQTTAIGEPPPKPFQPGGYK